MNDSKIIEKFFIGKSNRLTRNYQSIIESDDEIKQYLNNRFSDSKSYKESLIRIKNSIEIRPTCKTCGGDVEFIGNKKHMFREYCSIKCKNSSSLVVEHRKQTLLLKYGVDNYAKLDESTNKMHDTCIKKYNRSYPYNKESSERTKSEKYNDKNYNNYNKIVNTCIERYGCDFHRKFSEKSKDTTLKRYGVSSYFKTDICRLARKQQSSLEKEYNTKRHNKTFNSSKEEDISYILIKEKYNDVLTQYKSNEYPFVCDFYIPSINTYIECNYHWTHGKKPYNENDSDCISLVECWKNKQTQYYKNAVNTYTVRDVRKRTIALKNKLIYKEFFNIEELKKWLFS